MKLQGKVSLITGASRGIGRGIAEVFAEEGSDVAVNYIASPEKAGEVAAWVHLGSVQAGKVLPGRTHYAPTKLGLEALTRNMSAEIWVMKRPDPSSVWRLGRQVGGNQ